MENLIYKIALTSLYPPSERPSFVTRLGQFVAEINKMSQYVFFFTFNFTLNGQKQMKWLKFPAWPAAWQEAPEMNMWSKVMSRCPSLSCQCLLPTAEHRPSTLSHTWKRVPISKFPKRAASAKHLQDNTERGLNHHSPSFSPLFIPPSPPSLFSWVKTGTVAFPLAPKADAPISFRSVPHGFVFLIQYLCSAYVLECKTVCASNKQDACGP